MDLTAELEKLEPELKNGLAQASSLEDIEALRVEFLGRKGRLAELMGKIPSLPAQQRPTIGKLANEIKDKCTELLSQSIKKCEAEAEKRALGHFDASMPGRQFWLGSLHPVTLIMQEVCGIFSRLGFDIESGPEVEIDHYNFEALNMPPEHPARDMQDTLYITDNVLMRTHTSPVQVRTMLRRKPPLAIVAPGKVYRRDSDLTHTPMFHQIEGLMVGHDITMAHLRGTLLAFIQNVFGKNTGMRFRPSFFPFTEPSAEVDISCVICGGKGHSSDGPCRVCKTTGWVEILGCGMVDPAVYASVGYGDNVSGFAFGMGVERIAMLKYGINDLRMFFQNDNRFLQQFEQ